MERMVEMKMCRRMEKPPFPHKAGSRFQCLWWKKGFGREM